MHSTKDCPENICNNIMLKIVKLHLLLTLLCSSNQHLMHLDLNMSFQIAISPNSRKIKQVTMANEWHMSSTYRGRTQIGSFMDCYFKRRRGVPPLPVKSPSGHSQTVNKPSFFLILRTIGWNPETDYVLAQTISMPKTIPTRQCFCYKITSENIWTRSQL